MLLYTVQYQNYKPILHLTNSITIRSVYNVCVC